MSDLIIGLLAWAVAHTAYVPPPSTPDIEYQPQAALVAAVCPTEGESCEPRAYYGDGSGTVVMRDSFRHARGLRVRAILVHELVHYLQDLSGRWPEMTCLSWAERETEAYRMQAEYLVAQGVSRAAIAMPRFDAAQCSDDTTPTATADEFAAATPTPPRDGETARGDYGGPV